MRTKIYKVTKKNGDVHYYKDKTHTILHRKNGPAFISKDGVGIWALDGFLHRLDGPACVDYDLNRYYFLYGVFYGEIKSDEEWFGFVNGYITCWNDNFNK